MDSVQAITQFFTKMNTEFQQAAENSKNNQTLLTKLFKSETKEEKGRKKAEAKVKARKGRAKQKKKRNKLDTAEMLKSVFNKLLGKDKEKKGPGILKTVLGGAVLVSLLGAAAWKKFENSVKETVGSIKDTITGGISDFVRKITGQVDEEVDNIEEDVQGGLSEVEREVNSAKSRLTIPGAETEGQQPTQANQEVVDAEKELQDSGVTRPAEKAATEETKTTVTENTSTARRTTTTNDATKTTVVDETRVAKTEDVTNRETVSSTKETEKEPEEAAPTPPKTTRSRRSNRRSSSVVENVTGKRSTETTTKPESKTPAESAAEAMKKSGPAPSVSQMTSTQKKALAVLAKYESGAAGYDAVNQIGTNGGRGVAGFSGDIKRMPQHKGRPLTDFTIKEIKALQYDNRTLSNRQWIKAGKLHAVGRYQFIGNTLPGVAKRAGVSDNDKFTPEIQDRMALQLMKERGISPWVGPSDKATSAERAIIRQARKQELPTRRQKGGAIGIATDHIKKDEALSSLTKGSNDWIREGGKSVISKTDWSTITPNTVLHSYTDSVGKETIGWGSTYYDNISSGTQPVKKGDTVTKKKADSILNTNVSMLSRKLAKDAGSNWSKMSDKQQASLLSMGYNAPNFLSSPTFAPKLRGAIQRGDMKTAADNLEWGGPSSTRISESQQMLRSGPMDLTKVEAPKKVEESKSSTKTKTSAAKLMKKSGSAQQKKSQQKKDDGGLFGGIKKFFGFQQGGAVSDTLASDTLTESGELNLNKIIDRPDFDSAPKSAPKSSPFQQTDGSVSAAGNFQQSNGFLSSVGNFQQSMGSVAPAGMFQQTNGSVASAGNFQQSMGSVAPAGMFQQTNGSVSPAAGFQQSMGSVAPAGNFQQSMGSVAPAGNFQQSMGSVAPAAGFQQSMGSVAPATGFQQSNGSMSPVDNFQQTNRSVSPAAGFQQSMGSVAPAAGFQQSMGSVAPAGMFQQTDGSVAKSPSFIQQIASLFSFGRSNQTNGSVSPVDNFQQTDGSVSKSPSFAQSMATPSVLSGPQQSSGAASVAPAPVTAASLGLPSTEEIEKMTIEKLNSYLDPAKTGASEPRVFQAARAAKEKARQEGIKEEMKVQRLGQVAAVKAKMEVKIEAARAAAQKKSVEQFNQSNGSAGKSPSFAQSMGLATNTKPFTQTNGSVSPSAMFKQSNGSVSPSAMFKQRNGSAGTSPSFAQSMGMATNTKPFAQTNGSVAPFAMFQQTNGSVSPVDNFQQTDGSVSPADMFQQTDGSVSAAGNFQQSMGSVAPAGNFQQSMGSVAPAGMFQQTNGSVSPSAMFQQSNGSTKKPSPFRQALGSIARVAKFAQSMGSVGSMGGVRQQVGGYAGAGSNFVQSMGEVGENPKFSQAMGTVGNLLRSAQNFVRYQQGGSVSGPTVMGEAPTEGGIVPGSGTGDQYPIALPEGSFVLNKTATETMQRLQTGGVASISTKNMNTLKERFFAANEVYSETIKKKKKRPVVVVDIPSPSTPASLPPSPQQLETGSPMGINMNAIRGKMHRVNGGSLF